ncbi:MAG: group 1 glycosyl transferase [Marinobacter sp. T13-3]|nr:MAG: group 1 glycosyl transferase [Marinobacter sp. T13-3]
MRPLRILQFITPSGFYGAERWILALANNLEPGQVVCDLAVSQETSDQDLTLAELYPASVGQVHRVPMAGRFDWRVVNRLAAIIREREIDIIHSHGYKSDILGFLAARKAGIRCVSTPHGFAGRVGLKMALFIRLGTYTLRHFDAVAPLSEELVADMARFGVPEHKVRFIRNGVDLEEIDQALCEMPPREPVEDRKVIGFVGQMIPRKGIPDLLSVFDQLYGRDPSLRLQLLGDGRQRPELEQQAAAQASAPGIEFLGFRNDRLALLSRFDLFVMTSSLEGIPRCMMEAMAVGVPVVAYDIPGVDQLIEHDHNGLLVPYGDQQALADSCRRLLADAEWGRRLAAAARKTIETEYSAGRMAREYSLLFAQLMGRGSVSAHMAGGAG